VNQQRLIYKFECDQCDVGYVVYMPLYLHQCTKGHKILSSLIGKHFCGMHCSCLMMFSRILLFLRSAIINLTAASMKCFKFLKQTETSSLNVQWLNLCQGFWLLSFFLCIILLFIYTCLLILMLSLILKGPHSPKMLCASRSANLNFVWHETFKKLLRSSFFMTIGSCT